MNAPSLSKRLLSTVVAFGFVATTTAFSSSGCASSSDPTAGDSVASDNDAIDGNAAVARAMEWVDAELRYCQAPYGEADGDDACWQFEIVKDNHYVCDREENPKWDAYRSDCSGLVSYAWGLPAPGRDTTELSPSYGGTVVTTEIAPLDLRPGDAANIPDDHVVLFAHWNVKGRSAHFIEEPGCKYVTPYAREFDSDIEIIPGANAIHIVSKDLTMTTIRYTGSTIDPTECQPGGLYCGGDKVNGDKDTLYRCISGHQGEVTKQCRHGCSVNPGNDDTCKPGDGGGGTGGNNGGGMTSTGSGDPSTGSGNPGSSSSGSGSMSTGGGSNGCKPGGLYCGGDKVDGDRSSLYQCTSGSSGALVEACANGCKINDGADDGCRPGVEQGGGGCVAGGKYCGGDKVTGKKNILYRCDHGDQGTEIRQCMHGCNVNPGDDDSCQ